MIGSQLLLVALLAAPARGASVEALKEELARAQTLHRDGSLQDARNLYRQALSDAQTLRDPLAQAASLLGLAQIDLTGGRYASSISEGSEAAALYRDAKALKDEGIALTAAGQARYFSGDSAGALEAFQSALRLSRQSGDRQAEITRLNNIGNVYFALGHYGDAFDRYRAARERLGGMEHESWFASREQLTGANLAVLYQGIGEYRRALQAYRQMAEKGKALPPGEEAQMLANMGTLYRRLGDPVTALETYRSAQQLYRTHALAAGELAVLNNIGIDYALELGDYPRAIESFTLALGLAERSGAKRSAMTSLLYRGETLLRTGMPAKARADFAASRRIADDLGAQEEEWRSDYGLARVAAATGELARSDDLLRESISTIETMRKESSPASGRTGFLIERRDVYDLLLEHLAAPPNPDLRAIFTLMEQGRARNLQDRLKARIGDLEGLRARIPPETLIVEYWLGARSLARLVISARDTQLDFKRLTDAEAENLRRLPDALSDTKSRSWAAPAQAASDVLLMNIGALKGGSVRNVVVVPDGLLDRIPFEVLPDAGGLLIDRFTVSYLPFASALRPRGNPARRWQAPWKETMKAFADPLPAPGPAGTDLTSESASGLPDAAREVRNAAAALGGRCQLYIGKEAKKAALTDARPGTPVLHFATHAFADLQNPDRSYVLFAGAARGFDYMFLREAADVRAAEGSLVTVSACDSGNGQIERGEGIQSFSTAFLEAGARTVITSLWRVGDNPSAELMTRFYALLASGENASDALRGAKLAFRKSGGSASNPAYWAAFVLNGDPYTRIPRTVPWAFLGAAAGVCVTAVSLLARRIRNSAGMA